MKYIKNFFIGILIGTGCILPGISSGVLCVILGIYEKLLNSILNFFKDTKKHIKFLVPILLGILLGVNIFSRILEMTLCIYPIQTKSAFIGFIIGGVVLIYKNIKSGLNFKDLFYFIISFILGILTYYIQDKINIQAKENISNLYLIISGMLMSIGIVVPGVSSTIILMILGIYSVYLKALSTIYLPVLIPLFIGVFIGSIIFMKIIKRLLEKNNKKTMLSIIGYTLGSTIILIPQINSQIEFICALLSVICGYYIVTIIK